MDPEDRKTTAIPAPADESVVFTAAARQVVTAVQLSPAEVADQYEQIQARLASQGAPVVSAPLSIASYNTTRPPAPVLRFPRTRSSWIPRGVVAIAAPLVLLLLVVLTRSLWTVHASAHTLATYATGNGQRATITLVDGTVVTLNAGSRLVLLERFGGENRAVRLQGEAFFHVSHTSGVPFIVDAAGTRVTVLGTEFGVRAYQATSVRVAVRSGRVSMRDSILGAHDIGYASGSQVVVARDQNVDAALGFTVGRLVLDDVPLRDALADLDRWYDVTVRLADPTLGDVRLHATLLGGAPSDLTDMLRGLLGAQVVRNGRTITLYAPHHQEL